MSTGAALGVRGRSHDGAVTIGLLLIAEDDRKAGPVRATRVRVDRRWIVRIRSCAAIDHGLHRNGGEAEEVFVQVVAFSEEHAGGELLADARMHAVTE